ncbi:uncharacterized protein C8R40DRAFT_1178533 [Lentinula edodes]|uniref:uncharacterized protein n=1 Tax=Lentinula edodes TaxID=5353 RepID=UPI001E8CD29A|nr:uncharacterized protein C8R40DRAFT_1178533 [Lentinula edodes]KAH7867868.1 hypothetical protein C8R40DRAFT_1178533 [Lentinula edodes]
MTPIDYSRLKVTLQGHYYYLRREGPLPEGCGWFTLNEKKTYCAPLMAGQDTPTTVPFQIVGWVGTNLNNTGIFGGWSPTGQYAPGSSRRTFQLGPPLSGVFRDNWTAAITKLKEVQTAGANNTRKVRYLFVHENVPPLDSLIRLGCKVFCDLDEGEGPDELLSLSIPADKKGNAEWVEIKQTNIAGATVRMTFGLRCWRFNPNEPFSFAADIVRIDLLSTPHEDCGPRIGFPVTPPIIPQRGLTSSNPGHTPSYRSQPLFALQDSGGSQTDRALLTSGGPNGSPHTPTRNPPRYAMNYVSLMPEGHAINSPYYGVMQSFHGGSQSPDGGLGAAFQITSGGFTPGSMEPQRFNMPFDSTNAHPNLSGNGGAGEYRYGWNGGEGMNIPSENNKSGANYHGTLSSAILTADGQSTKVNNGGTETAPGAIAGSGTPSSSAGSDKMDFPLHRQVPLVPQYNNPVNTAPQYVYTDFWIPPTFNGISTDKGTFASLGRRSVEVRDGQGRETVFSVYTELQDKPSVRERRLNQAVQRCIENGRAPRGNVLVIKHWAGCMDFTDIECWDRGIVNDIFQSMFGASA